MSLDQYVTLGRSGLRVSPLCLGAMTFGEEFGIGSDPATSERILERYVERGGNFVDTANIYNGGRSEEIIGQYLARDRARRSAPRHRHQVLRQHVARRPERRRREPQGDPRCLRAVAAAHGHRLHRSLLAALVGPIHAHRGDDAHARRSRALGQGPLRRVLGHAGLAHGAGADDCARAWLGAARGAAGRVLAARAHGRRRAHADGAGIRARRHAMVATAIRLPERQVHACLHAGRVAGAFTMDQAQPERGCVPSSSMRCSPSPAKRARPRPAARSPGCARVPASCRRSSARAPSSSSRTTWARSTSC